MLIYNYATSFPATAPSLVIVYITKATSPQRSARPPGIISLEAGPRVAEELTLMLV